jgi:hypothetical protein
MSPDPTFEELRVMLTEQMPSAGPNDVKRAARVLEMMFKLHKIAPPAEPTTSKPKEKTTRRHKEKPVAESMRLKAG